MKHRPEKKRKRTKLHIEIEKSALNRLPKRERRLSKKERQVRRIAFRTAKLSQIARDQIRLAAELEEGRVRNDLTFDVLHDMADSKKLAELSTEQLPKLSCSKIWTTEKVKEENSSFVSTDTLSTAALSAKQENFEIIRRAPIGSSMKLLLPIKTISGKVIPVMRTVISDNGEDSPDQLNQQEDERKGIDGITEEEKMNDHQTSRLSRPETIPELFAERHRLLTGFKNKIASACNSVIVNPEQSLNRLKEVLAYAAGVSDPLVKLTVQKLALVSLEEVFVDIVPQYKIREITEKEKVQKISKETKELWAYEENLLNKYKKYLQIMEQIVKGQKSRLKDFRVHSSKLCLTAVECYGRLLAHHPFFNYRDGIIIVLVPLMTSKDDQVRRKCCEIFEHIFDTDISGEISLEAVRAINRFARKNTRMLHPDMLYTLLKLKITHIEKSSTESIKEKINRRKRMMRMMSRNERKHYKRVELLKRELEEAEVETKESTVLQNHTKIITSVFHVYFRLLRQMSRSKLLLPVLEGLSKFAHLIGIEFFDDIISLLYEIATATVRFYL
ncbi:unnamed protein product [Soboliphyme baturini]|uniref:NOC3p domain-containing protein n=1 Tax=Soboliphyme baturini TaxID=241478 RepID=A0A183IZP9_9BILA|nr:unnamed protein product [Soboliphyme baturini]